MRITCGMRVMSLPWPSAMHRELGAGGPAVPWQAVFDSGCAAGCNWASGHSEPGAGSPAHPDLLPLTWPVCDDAEVYKYQMTYWTLWFLKASKRNHLFGTEVQSLAEEFTDQLPSEDVRVDLQQWTQFQTERGPPLSIRTSSGLNAAIRGWGRTTIHRLHPAHLNLEEELTHKQH